MSRGDKTPKHIRFDERNHAEKLLLDQLMRLDQEARKFGCNQRYFTED